MGVEGMELVHSECAKNFEPRNVFYILWKGEISLQLPGESLVLPIVGEKQNLAPQKPALATKLDAQLGRWLKETGAQMPSVVTPL